MTRFAIAASVLAAAIGSAMGQAQTAPPMQTQAPKMQGEHDCAQALQGMKAMKAECDRADQQLDQQVQKMKTAQGDAKAEAMVATIELMAQQRQQMEQRSAEFMPKFLTHLQQHMAMIAQDPQKGQQAMAQCIQMMQQQGGEMARPAGQQMP